MRTILPCSCRSTTRLGFGCAYLVGGWSQKTSLEQVYAALDVGYGHFDVAPAYGLGTAESILGNALRGRRDQVTLATKVGLSGPKYGSALLFARACVRPLKALRPNFGKSTGGKIYASTTRRGQFKAEEVTRSLHRSLRKLRTDHVDLLLLHEVRASDLTDELLGALSQFRKQGTALALGTATSRLETSEIQNNHGSFFDVWQYSWDVLETGETSFRPYTITHRSLHRAFDYFRDIFAQNPDIASSLSEAINMDLRDPNSLSNVLIGASLAANPDGMTLVGSRQKERIRANAVVLTNPVFLHAGRELTSRIGVQDTIMHPARD